MTLGSLGRHRDTAVTRMGHTEDKELCRLPPTLETQGAKGPGSWVHACLWAEECG